RMTSMSPFEERTAWSFAAGQPPRSERWKILTSGHVFLMLSIDRSVEASSTTTTSQSRPLVVSRHDFTVFKSRSPSLCAAIAILALMAVPFRKMSQDHTTSNRVDRARARERASGLLRLPRNQATGLRAEDLVMERQGPLGRGLA